MSLYLGMNESFGVGGSLVSIEKKARNKSSDPRRRGEEGGKKKNKNKSGSISADTDLRQKGERI